MINESDDESELELDQALLEFMRRFDAGNPEDRDTFLQRYPQLSGRLSELLDTADWIETMAGPILAPNPLPLPDSKRSSEKASEVSFDPNAVTMPAKGSEPRIISPDESHAASPHAVERL
jgi:hypothetical protein